MTPSDIESSSPAIASVAAADAASAANQREESWTAVSSARARSKSLSETAAAGAAAGDTSSSSAKAMSKSARKNARRKERKRFEKMWGVRPDEIGAGDGIAADSREGGGRNRSQSLVELVTGSTSHVIVSTTCTSTNSNTSRIDGNEHQCPHDDDYDEALSRALVASVLEHSPSATTTARDDGDPRRKRLRNLRKKISAAESLQGASRSDLDDGQRTKLDRLPSLRLEADSLQGQLDDEEQHRLRIKAEQKARDIASHRRRIAEWSSLSDGTTIQGFRAGADQDEYACPLCAGPLEAATACAPCRHVFCRACLEDALSSAADRSGGDPRSINCPLCRAALFDASNDRMLVEPAATVRKRMRKRKCRCKCGEEVALSSLRAHLRHCSEAAPGLFADDERKRFGHEFERPRLDPDKIAEMAGRKRRGGGGGGNGPVPVQSSRQAVARGLVPEGYDEEAALQAALALSSLET